MARFYSVVIKKFLASMHKTKCQETKPKKFVSSVEVRLKKGRNEFSNFKLLCFEEYLVAFKALDQPISERTNADGSEYHSEGGDVRLAQGLRS